MRRSAPLERLRDSVAGTPGLAAGEALERLRRFGPNRILEPAVGLRWRVAVDTARDPMIWFLAGTAALYAGVGETTEAWVLLFAMLPLVGMDAFLHRRTQASLQGLASRLATRATAMRDGVAIEIDATEVVPGDLVRIDPGEYVPADGVFAGGFELQVDESMLTGESFPVRKKTWSGSEGGAAEAAIENVHWGFAGTRLLTGHALLRVVYTGAETLYGEIARSAARGGGARTPLQQAIANLVAVLTATALVFCAILAFVRIRQGHGWVEGLVSAAMLAVAALPEEFPIVFTFYLGVGVYRLARRKALVRRAVSVENIGRVTTILSDKTGTVTAGELHLTHVIEAAGVDARYLLRLAAVASRPRSGEPLDDAIFRELETRGLEAPALESLSVFPFAEARRRETGVVRDSAGGILAATKGAAETILGMCALDAGELASWRRRVDDLAEAGHRVIACAARSLQTGEWAGGEPDRGFQFAGLLAFEDPVRKGVPEAVEICRAAGIHPILVTGDHPATARAVAREIGLGNGAPVVLSAEEVEGQNAASEIRRADAIARARPDQKLHFVRELQRVGEIVVVTGDGVNDVPALQAADVGVAMGGRGTRSAREIAAIVLLDDDFATLVGAIAEGRQLFRNLRRSFQYLLLIHIPFVVTAAVIPLAGYPLLYLPLHIVWLELIIHPTAMLVFQDLPLRGRLEPVRRDAPARFFSWAEWVWIATLAGAVTILVTASYVASLGPEGDAEHARSMALLLLVVWSAGITAALSELRTGISRILTAATVAASLLAVQLPASARLLHLRPLHADDLAIVIGAGAVAAAAVWITAPWVAGKASKRRVARARTADG